MHFGLVNTLPTPYLFTVPQTELADAALTNEEPVFSFCP